MSQSQAIDRWGVARGGLPARAGLVLLAVALLLAIFSSGALAGPVWDIHSVTNTTVAPGGVIRYNVVVANLGDTPAPATLGGDANNCVPGSPPPSDPSKCTIVRADFPAGLTPLRVSGQGGASCTVQASSIVCLYAGNSLSTQFANSSLAAVPSILFTARVNSGVTGTVTSAFQVSGGGAANVARTADPTLVSATPPPFGIDGFDAQVTADAAGDPQTQAGAHPFEASTDIAFNTVSNPSPLGGDLYPVESTRDIVVDLPAGFVGDTTAADRCTADQLANSEGFRALPLCPSTSQVGTALIFVNNDGNGAMFGPLPVYNVVPPAGAPARLGFNVVGTVVTLDATLRTGGDYGLRATVRGVSELRIQSTRLTLWGVPSDPVHDRERACSGAGAPVQSGVHCSSGAPRKAFLRNPTSCTAPGVGLLTTVSIDSWEHPGVFVGASSYSHLPPGFPYAPADWGPQQGPKGCEKLPFEPALTGGPPADARAGSPVGFAFDLSLPQTNDPDTLATADLKKAVVTLPEGVRVSPSSADGLQGCSSAQIALRSDADPACPDGSKLGTVSIVTPLLAQPLEGSIYLAAPFDNPFGSLVAIYLVARGQGVTIKLAGDVQMDPATGRITTTIDDNPQAPFTDVHLQFDGGPRAALSLPDACGTYRTHAELTSWARPDTPVAVESSFTVGQDESGQACPAHFAPQFDAGTASNSAGHSSSFLVRVARGDLDQELRSLTVNGPTGLTGRIASVPLCPAAAAAAGTCAERSRIGDVTVGAGAGSNPFYITNGRAYLTGPYKGAPFGLSIVVPAVAGPFDLGNVVVRSAIFVDKHTAGLHIVSDTLPTILQGIPLNVRDIRVNVNRRGFFLNATSCAEKKIGATFTSTGGMRASASTRYQAGDCASLGFKPRMVLTVGGRGHTAAGRTTPLTTTLTMPSKGQANLRYVRVTLPRTLNARLTVIQDACTRQQFETDIRKCAHAKAGTATAVTPLLRHALRGNAYFVTDRPGFLPNLIVALRGQVAFDLVGKITIPGGKQLATTFATAPDVPVRSFTLKLFGDPRNASVGTLANLCTSKSRRAKVAIDYIAQNGRVVQTDQALRVNGCPRSRAGRHRHG